MYPFVIGGTVLVGLVLAIWVGYGLGVNRAKRAFARLVAAHQRDEEADRERLRRTLEKTQQDLAQAAVDIETMSAERRRAISDRARFEREAAEAHELLRDANAIRVTLESDLRRQRESQQREREAKAALDAEIRLRHETEKALSAAGDATATAHQQLAGARAEIVMERRQAADFAQRHEQAQARLRQQEGALRELSTQAELQERRLDDMKDLEQQLLAAQQRLASLELELAKVAEVASSVGEAKLDREELEVRLEMAAAAVRIARKEADRHRADAIERSQKLSETKQELSLLRASVRQLEQQLAEGRVATETLQPLQSEVSRLKTNLDEQSLSLKQLMARAESAEHSAAQLRRAHEIREAELRQLRVGQQRYGEQSAELLSLGVELEKQQSKLREQSELQSVNERLEKDLVAARAQLLSLEEQSEELHRLRDLVQRTRNEQQEYLEAERRLLATQEELRSVRQALEVAERRLEQHSGPGDVNATPRHDSMRAKVLTEELDTERAAMKELRGQLQVANAQLSDLERLRLDNSALRDEAFELRQHKEASLALEQLQREHRKLRLESELSARRVQELSSEREELMAQRGDAEQQRNLEQEVKELRRRERLLEAQIYACGQTPDTQTRISTAPLAATGTRASEVEAGIATLVDGGQRTVVLADRQGFTVATSGELLAQDGLAAFSALALDVARGAETLLPLGSVQRIWIIDKYQTQVSCRFFECGGETFTLCTLGQSPLNIDAVDAVLATVMNKMTVEASGG
jgi:hypothetical protein